MYLQQLQAKNEWTGKTFSNSVPRYCFILLHVVLFVALFLTEPRWEKHFPQSPWEHLVWWCSGSLRVLFLFPLELTSSPLATALMTPKCPKCDTDLWRQSAWGSGQKLFGVVGSWFILPEDAQLLQPM